VVLLERAEGLGGQGRTIEFAPGFRAAPLGLDPGWLPDPIARALRLETLEPIAGDTPLSVMIEPGAALTLTSDPRRAAEAIAVHSADDAAKWPAFTGQMTRLAGFLEALYLEHAPDVDLRGAGELLPLLRLGGRFRALRRTDMIEFLRTLPLSVWELLDDWFACAPLKAAVATAGVIDLRQGPRSGGTGYVLLHYLVGAPHGAIRGRVPWRAGPAAFTASAEAAARSAGVVVRSGAAVTSLRVADDAIAGVVLAGGEEIAAGTVVSTADPARTLLEWIDPVWLDPELVRDVANVRHRGCTAFVLYALEALPEFPGLVSRGALGGLVSLTQDLVTLERAADAAKYGEIPAKPHVELHVPTVHWPDLAPAGRHVLIARVHYAPYVLKNGAWDAARRDALGAGVTAAIEAIYPGFRSRIAHQTTWTPKNLEERFGLREGSASQGELALDQILFMRPTAGWGRHATPIAGLYLGGAGTHPGPGILGGPGWLAAGRVLADRRAR
jgi:phytoene dehydrogenase-like protein